MIEAPAPANYIPPPILEQRLVLIARRLAVIYKRVRRLQEEKARNDFQPGTGSFVARIKDWPLSRYLGPAPSRLNSVTDAISGLEYSVWCVGVTLLATGGMEAMERVAELVAQGEDGSRISSWLDHRWDDVTDGHQRWIA